MLYRNTFGLKFGLHHVFKLTIINLRYRLAWNFYHALSPSLHLPSICNLGWENTLTILTEHGLGPYAHHPHIAWLVGLF